MCKNAVPVSTSNLQTRSTLILELVWDVTHNVPSASEQLKTNVTLALMVISMTWPQPLVLCAILIVPHAMVPPTTTV